MPKIFIKLIQSTGIDYFLVSRKWLAKTSGIFTENPKCF